MPEIITDGKPLDVNAAMNIPAMEIPGFRTLVATEHKVQNKIMVQVKGGIGDYICVEPTIRYMCKTFRDTEIYVSTYVPEFFTHLPTAGVFDLGKGETPDWSKFHCFRSIGVGDELSCQFLTHLYCQVVDYHSLLMLRTQLEPEERCVTLPKTEEATALASQLIDRDKDVLIHPGRTWPSRTFSKDWWDGVIDHLIRLGARPVIIGAESMNNCGTVDVNTDGCEDLRGRTSLIESVAVTTAAKVLLTNDSSPLHMAAAGDAWIGFISTVRKPGTLMHWRNGGEFGWKMKNFSKGCLVDGLDLRPSNQEMIRFDQADSAQWLPKPLEYAEWAVSKLNG